MFVSKRRHSVREKEGMGLAERKRTIAEERGEEKSLEPTAGLEQDPPYWNRMAEGHRSKFSPDTGVARKE